MKTKTKLNFLFIKTNNLYCNYICFFKTAQIYNISPFLKLLYISVSFIPAYVSKILRIKNKRPAPFNIIKALSLHKTDTINHKEIPIVERYKSYIIYLTYYIV